MPKKNTKKKIEELNIEIKTVQKEKTVVQKAYDYATSKGYQAKLTSGILLFPYGDDNDKLIKDLIENFGAKEDRLVKDMGDVNVKVLPFSYGFTGDKIFQKEKDQGYMYDECMASEE